MFSGKTLCLWHNGHLLGVFKTEDFDTTFDIGQKWLAAVGGKFQITKQEELGLIFFDEKNVIAWLKAE